MICLVTDFGLEGPYIGQVKGVLQREAPGLPVIDLLSDAPPFEPKPTAYLLPRLAPEFPPGTAFLCVVDPGVGSDRPACVVEADGRWFVGPGNGLFELVSRRASSAAWWRIVHQPERISASFHGRDLFAPMAGRLASGRRPTDDGWCVTMPAEEGGRPDWPDDLREVVYIDRFGNAMTGLRAAMLPENAVVSAGGRELAKAHKFSDVLPGGAFCYENSSGLLEIAVNGGRAADDLGLRVGSRITIDRPSNLV